MATLTGEEREQIAREAADHIVSVLIPGHDKVAAFPEVTIEYAGGEQPPRDAEAIKAHLLDGHVWISWTDDTVLAAMRRLHGAPQGFAAGLFGELADDAERLRRARRIAASWGYCLFRWGNGAPDGVYCVTNASAGEDPTWALAQNADLGAALGWVLDGCNQDALELAWEYFRGGGRDEDWVPLADR